MRKEGTARLSDSHVETKARTTVECPSIWNRLIRQREALFLGVASRGNTSFEVELSTLQSSTAQTQDDLPPVFDCNTTGITLYRLYCHVFYPGLFPVSTHHLLFTGSFFLVVGVYIETNCHNG